MEEQPERLAGAIARFLRKTAGAPLGARAS